VDISEFDKNRYLCLSTFRKTGAEVKTPVWFAAQAGKLYVFTGGDSGKVKRLRNSSRARIAPCSARGDVRGAWRDTNARVITDAGLVERAHAALRAKYGWQMWITDVLSRLAGKIGKRAFLEVDFAQPAK
jgi:PPOX class probable F420-dependent enzyme